MKDHTKNHTTDPLMDTQRLLQGVDPAQDGFNLEDILAEYGVKAPSASADALLAEFGAVPPAPEKPVPEEPAPEEPSPAQFRKEGEKVLIFPSPAQQPAETWEEPSPTLTPDEDLDDISPETLFGLPSDRGDTLPLLDDDDGVDTAAELEEEQETEQAPAAIPLVSMADIVASTVDAVKEEQAQKQEIFRKKLEKQRKKTEPKPVRKKEPTLRQPMPAKLNEPGLSDRAGWHKRWYRACRQSLMGAVPVLIILWLPWFLQQAGLTVPFFSVSPGNASLCVLIPQVLICILCWPVFQTALEKLKERADTLYFLTALANLVTIFDELTLLFLPRRANVPPLGGIAATAAVFALWGLSNWHRGLWESFRTGALGSPSHLVDFCPSGIAKGSGGSSGFYTRTMMEDTASQWQRLLLPVIIVASLVFAVLSSVGREQSQNLLWCWSAILCTATSLTYPLCYFVPFGRLAARLSASGAAVAGQYGAAALTSSRRLVVTDTDLFPPGTVTLNGLKLYGEERNRAISYTATLAVQGGGCLARIFEDICKNDRIAYQHLEHFHIHDENGLSGMIRGETVLVGPPIFMRHRGVRLPATLPAKTTVCLAVDGELTAVFAVKYNASSSVESALRSLSHSGLQLTLAVRDGNITPKLIKTRFGTDGGAIIPETSERLNLSDPMREAEAPNGLLFREGIFPFVEMVAGSRRLCHVVRVGTALSLLGSIFGTLLSFYLTFIGSYAVLSPVMVLTYLLLWVVPLIPLLWGVDKT